MAKKELLSEINIPSGCTITKDKLMLTVKGAKGEISRKLPGIDLQVAQTENKLNLSYIQTGKKQKALLFTTTAHIKNMIKGVQEGFAYKLKICSGHFPMNVSLKKDSFEIKNFIGEKVPRVLKIKEGVKVEIKGDSIDVTGINIELVGQTAGSIEKLTRRPGFDKRVFQDGIYITEKNGKKI